MPVSEHVPESDRPSARRGPPGFILLSSSPLFRAPSPPTPPDSFRTGLAARVSALFATSPGASTHPRGFHPSLRSVLRRSQPLDGFLRAPASGPVSSPCRVQDTRPSRGFSLCAAQRLVAAGCPLAVGVALLGTNLPARPSTGAPPRLRGVAPHRDTVRSREVISPAGPPLPSSVSCSSRLSTHRAGDGLPVTSAHGVPGFGLRSRARRYPPPTACLSR